MTLGDDLSARQIEYLLEELDPKAGCRAPEPLRRRSQHGSEGLTAALRSPTRGRASCRPVLEAFGASSAPRGHRSSPPCRWAT